MVRLPVLAFESPEQPLSLCESLLHFVVGRLQQDQLSRHPAAASAARTLPSILHGVSMPLYTYCLRLCLASGECFDRLLANPASVPIV